MYQINSMLTVNGGASYHGKRGGEGTYEYKEGFNYDGVRQFVTDNLNMTLENSPLPNILNVLLSDWKKGGKQFGQMDLVQSNFNKTDEIPVNDSFLLEMLNLFNLCGKILRTQTIWWQSNLLHKITEKSKTIDQVIEKGLKCFMDSGT
jgi:hypothetical protein